MRKTFFILIAALTATLSMNAQVYLGGSVGFNKSSIERESSAEKSKSNSFSIAPEIGYSCNEKIDLGIHLLFRKSKFPQNDVTTIRLNGWAVTPYVRYNIFQFNKFSVLAKASVDYGKSTTESTIHEDFTLPRKTKDKTTEWGINVMPVLKYSL